MYTKNIQIHRKKTGAFHGSQRKRSDKEQSDSVGVSTDESLEFFFQNFALKQVIKCVIIRRRKGRIHINQDLYESFLTNNVLMWIFNETYIFFILWQSNWLKIFSGKTFAKSCVWKVFVFLNSFVFLHQGNSPEPLSFRHFNN